jgi:hypothetical protein
MSCCGCPARLTEAVGCFKNPSGAGLYLPLRRFAGSSLIGSASGLFKSLFDRFNSVFDRLGIWPSDAEDSSHLAGAGRVADRCANVFFPVYSR